MPWHVEGQFDADVSVEILNENDFLICEVGPFEENWTDAEIQRVHLIAAAPELLEALNDCDKAFAAWQVGQIPGRPEDILALIVKVRAAIAKVTL
jgi:hypothetical protein